MDWIKLYNTKWGWASLCTWQGPTRKKYWWDTNLRPFNSLPWDCCKCWSAWWSGVMKTISTVLETSRNIRGKSLQTHAHVNCVLNAYNSMPYASCDSLSGVHSLILKQMHSACWFAQLSEIFIEIIRRILVWIDKCMGVLPNSGEICERTDIQRMQSSLHVGSCTVSFRV